MKIGVADYGLNVWYGGLYDIEERLMALKALGLHGTERLEAISAVTIGKLLSPAAAQSTGT